jgi:glycine cleavage system regulatory protein
MLRIDLKEANREIFGVNAIERKIKKEFGFVPMVKDQLEGLEKTRKLWNQWRRTMSEEECKAVAFAAMASVRERRDILNDLYNLLKKHEANFYLDYNRE